MAEYELFERIKRSILSLSDYSSFTIRVSGEVSTLKGVLKVPLNGSVVFDQNAKEILLKGEIAVLNYSFEGFYHNKNGDVSAALNGKEEHFKGEPIDIASILQGVQSFLSTHYDEISESENVLTLVLKKDVSYDLMRELGFNVELVDKYLKEINVYDIAFTLGERSFDSIGLRADAKLEGIPVDALVTIRLEDINKSRISDQ